MKLILKIIIGLVGLVGLTLLLVLVFADAIARAAMESSIRAQTGMDVRIGRVEIGFVRPTVRVEEFAIYNTAEFGGSPMLTLPEVYVEYDRDAARRQELHLRLLRLNLSELHIVEDANGRTNLTSFPAWVEGLQIPRGQLPGSGVEFRGIDTLDASFGRIRLTSLRDPSRNMEINLGIRNEIIQNVHSETNLYFLLTKIVLRAGTELFDRPPISNPAAPRSRAGQEVSPAPPARR